MQIKEFKSAEFIVQNFIDEGKPNAWVKFKHGQYYLKRGHRMILDAFTNSNLEKTLELNNVQIEEKYSGQGEFSEFIQAMHKQIKYHVLFIENVLNDKLAVILKKHNWYVYDVYAENYPGEPKHYYKVLR